VNARRHELHLLTGAYAADALTGAELAEFEKHLARCEACTEEVRGLRETAARLGTATAIAPPPGMRQQVMDAVGRTRQVPPPGRVLRALGAPRGATRPRRVLPRPVAAVAVAAMAAAIVVLAVLQIGTRQQLEQTQAGNRAVAAVLAAPDARIQASGTTVGGTVTAVISPRDREAVVTTASMPAPAGTRVYQLWVISTAGARSVGLLSASGTGATSPVLVGNVMPGDRLGITIEPAGGSSRPTTTPVVLISARLTR
jgi:anti-sigma-K factor RskA